MNNNLEKKLFEILMDILVAIDLSDDECIDNDFAVELTESVVADLQVLKRCEIEKVLGMLDTLYRKEDNVERKRFLKSFPESSGILK